MNAAGPLPRPRTAEGREGLARLVREPGAALIALDFDGTLSPIVDDPGEARAHPDVPLALTRLADVIGTLAIITGRPAQVAVQLGDLGQVPGLVVLGHYGSERWQDGALSAPPPEPGVAQARARLPKVLADARAPDGTWVEDKGSAVAVHTRQTSDPAAALEALSQPLENLASQVGLAVEPGRMVIELRPHGADKGAALNALVAERHPRTVMFCGDDLGDRPAFSAVHDLRQSGIAGINVLSGSAEVSALASLADLVVDGPAGVSALLLDLAAAVR
jgi:trehalose 6-phosphate phosphatase